MPCVEYYTERKDDDVNTQLSAAVHWVVSTVVWVLDLPRETASVVRGRQWWVSMTIYLITSGQTRAMSKDIMQCPDLQRLGSLAPLQDSLSFKTSPSCTHIPIIHLSISASMHSLYPFRSSISLSPSLSSVSLSIYVGPLSRSLHLDPPP